MSSSTEICLADARKAQGCIMRAQQVNNQSNSGHRLTHISQKICELVRVLESQVIAEQHEQR